MPWKKKNMVLVRKLEMETRVIYSENLSDVICVVSLCAGGS